MNSEGAERKKEPSSTTCGNKRPGAVKKCLYIQRRRLLFAIGLSGRIDRSADRGREGHCTTNGHSPRDMTRGVSRVWGRRIPYL